VIEFYAHDPDIERCNIHYGEYLNYLDEVLPDKERVKELRKQLRPFKGKYDEK